LQRLQLCDDSKFARAMFRALELEVNEIIKELSDDDDEEARPAAASHNLDGPRPAPTSRRLDDRYDADSSYTRKVAKARTVARRILDADNTNTIEQLVLAGYKQLSSPWRALVQRVPDHTDITAPFLSLTLEKAGQAGMAGQAERSAGGPELQSYSAARAYVELAQCVHPFAKLRRELDALSTSAQETDRSTESSTEQEQELSEHEPDMDAEARAPPPPPPLSLSLSVHCRSPIAILELSLIKPIPPPGDRAWHGYRGDRARARAHRARAQ
jgi:hypothetical protein